MPRAYYNGRDLALGGQFQEIYTTEETRIGTWIDGKPLYRRVGRTTSGAEGEEKVILSLLNAEIKKCIVTASNATVSHFLPIVTDNVVIMQASYNKTKGLMVYTGHPGYQNRALDYFIEYTKTNDSSEYASQSVTSTVLPKSSGTITKDGKQYDYELPDIVSAASSAAKILNGIGSSANKI